MASKMVDFVENVLDIRLLDYHKKIIKIMENNPNATILFPKGGTGPIIICGVDLANEHDFSSCKPVNRRDRLTMLDDCPYRYKDLIDKDIDNDSDD